jgi:hypothetical protein
MGIVPYFVVVLLVAIPVYLLAKRVGYNPWLFALGCFVPLGFVIALWILALRRWPNETQLLGRD